MPTTNPLQDGTLGVLLATDDAVAYAKSLVWLNGVFGLIDSSVLDQEPGEEDLETAETTLPDEPVPPLPI